MNRTGRGGGAEGAAPPYPGKGAGIVLRTTVMTGFPGEGREEFEGAVLLYQGRCGFERLGCFAFSPEEGTPAYTMEAAQR